MFVRFDDEGLPCFDTSDAAMDYARTQARFKGDQEPTFYLQREWAPKWLCRLVRDTRLDWIAYREVTS
jgi:hypothetical protein